MMKAKILGIASFSLFFLLSVFAPVHSQEAANGAPSGAPPPLSAIAHDFTTWLNHVAGNGAKNHRAATADAAGVRTGVRARRVEQGMVGIRAVTRRVQEENAHARSNKGLTAHFCTNSGSLAILVAILRAPHRL